MNPKRRLANIDVSFISLVDKGANLKTIIYKSIHAVPEDEITLEKPVEILKTNEDKQMVFGIVYSPEETDSQGDITSLEEIEKAAHAFMKNRRTTQVDQQHDGDADEGFVVESWITKDVDPLFGSDPVGSWAVGIKVQNTETWDKIKKGDITGLSLAGRAETEDLSKGLIKSLIETIKGKFTEAVHEDEARKKAWSIASAFESAIMEVFTKEYTGDKKTALLGVVEEMKKYIESEFKADSVAKEGKVLSSKNKKTIQAVIEALNNLLNTTTKEKSMELTKEVQDFITETVSKTVTEALAKNQDPDPKDQDPDPVEVLTKTVEDLNGRLEKFEKSKGTKQIDGDETDPENGELAPNTYKDPDGKLRKHVFA